MPSQPAAVGKARVRRAPAVEPCPLAGKERTLDQELYAGGNVPRHHGRSKACWNITHGRDRDEFSCRKRNAALDLERGLLRGWVLCAAPAESDRVPGVSQVTARWR